MIITACNTKEYEVAGRIGGRRPSGALPLGGSQGPEQYKQQHIRWHRRSAASRSRASGIMRPPGQGRGRPRARAVASGGGLLTTKRTAVTRRRVLVPPGPASSGKRWRTLPAHGWPCDTLPGLFAGEDEAFTDLVQCLLVELKQEAQTQTSQTNPKEPRGTSHHQ